MRKRRFPDVIATWDVKTVACDERGDDPLGGCVTEHTGLAIASRLP